MKVKEVELISKGRKTFQEKMVLLGGTLVPPRSTSQGSPQKDGDLATVAAPKATTVKEDGPAPICLGWKVFFFP